MAGFEFVNVTNPREVKQHSRRIRRHVMKDIGKTRRKARPQDSRETTIIDEPARVSATVTADSKSVEDRTGLSGALELILGNPRSSGQLSQMVYPIEMNEVRLGLVRYIVEEARRHFMPFRFAWLSTGMADPASWHITLANAALLRSTPSLEGNTTAEFDTNLDSMKYYTQSLESISVRLKGLGESDSVSEGLVVAVTGFVCHDGAVGNFERMSIHMKGLKRIVEKRGGLENLNSPILRLMISWLDLSAATFLNERPYFNVPKGSITEIDTGDDTKYLDILLQSWHYKCPALGDIVSAIKVTAAVAVYINKHSHDDKFWTDDIMMARLLGPASYEILTLEGRPLPNNPSDPGYSGVAAREAFRRAALIFLADVKIRGQARAWELPKHLDAFRQISQLPLVDWAVVPELSLWAHVIAAIQEETAGRALHVATILGIMEILGLRTGSRAIVVVKGIIWVDSIMADKAAVLCEEIDYHRGVNELSQRLQNAPLDPQLEDFNADQFLPT